MAERGRVGLIGLGLGLSVLADLGEAGPAPGHLAGGVGQTGEHDEVTEGHRLVDEGHGHDRTEPREPVGVGLEVARVVDLLHAAGIGGPGLHQGPRSHGHPVVEHHRRQVQHQPEPHDSYPGDLPVHAREGRHHREAQRERHDRQVVVEHGGAHEQRQPSAQERELTKVRARAMAPGRSTKTTSHGSAHRGEDQEDHTATVSTPTRAVKDRVIRLACAGRRR